jgi:sugar phosphate permease
MTDRRTDRPFAWGVTWIAYASYYLGRKGFSAAKKTLHDTLGIGESALGAIDTAYLAAYAIGLFASGYAGDRVGARRLIAVGLLGSAIACAGFGSMNGALGFGALFFDNGLAQSTGWPGTMRAMAEWTTPRNRGTVMAFWSTCYQVGGIAATAFAGYMIRARGWRFAFYGPARVMAVVAMLVYAFLKPGRAAGGASGSSRPIDVVERGAAQRAVFRDPVLWSFGVSYFFIKYVRYALLFWLPYYLSTSLGYAADRAAYVSTAFEAGGILGVIVLGSLSDRLTGVSRAGLSALSLVGLAAVLLGRAVLPIHGLGSIVVTLFLVGALLFGPDSLLSGAAAQDAGGLHGTATATGLVNGVGSIGGLLEGLTLPPLAKHFGWSALFPTLGIFAACAGLALVPTLIHARGRGDPTPTSSSDRAI